MANARPKKEKPVKKQTNGHTAAVGRRREASARVRLLPNGKGVYTVNGKSMEDYFGKGPNLAKALTPLRLTNQIDKYDVSVRVVGGGIMGQLNATVHGIARALEKIDRDAHRPVLKKAGLMTRDPRAKERRKAGFAQKARARKSSPKR